MTTSVPVPAEAGGKRLGPDAGGASALEVSERIGTLDRPNEAPPKSEQREFAERPPRWYQIIWSSGKARIGIYLLGFFVLMAIFAPLIAPYDPQDGSFAPLLSPSWEHLMGTTSQGYDIFSQFVYGTRLSLLVGIFGGLFATVIAVFVGMISGYSEGTFLDNFLSQSGPGRPGAAADDGDHGVQRGPRTVGDVLRHRHHQLGRGGPREAGPDHHPAVPRVRHCGEVLR
jgi:N-terminal TM domain of oligopeptide transport permease C